MRRSGSICPAALSATLLAAALETPATYLDRIAALDDVGPAIHAVVTVAPAASIAVAGRAKGPLAGRAVLVKDNIETRDMPTTAGSLALKDNATGRDAPLVARLRKAGAVILGKTNLSEWANFRGDRSSSGWSAVGGQTRNPHALDRSPCGSSSGSGAAVAAGLAWAAIGTETDGSITCPASVNGVVGFKPTVGLVSRALVVPISPVQDTAGPMTTSVADAALLLTAMAGPDKADPATAEAGRHAVDFSRGLGKATLAGVRVGVLRRQVGPIPALGALFDRAVADMKRAGAVVVEIDYEPAPRLGEAEFAALLHEFRESVTAYLA
ncbi:MAG TPA: amidase family protein, partial [Novosphingobium sp.]|nr:amidase family protein [Novosphingobium sp.]